MIDTVLPGNASPRDRLPHARGMGAPPRHLIAWPHNPTTGRQVRPDPVGLRRDRSPPFPSEKVCIVAQARRAAGEGNALPADIDPGQIEFLDFATDRGWCATPRHRGRRSPREARGPRLAFNAWAKYDNWRLDDELPRQMAGYLASRLAADGNRPTRGPGRRKHRPSTAPASADDGGMMSGMCSANPGRRPGRTVLCDHLECKRCCG